MTVTLHAILPIPPGLNRQYVVGRSFAGHLNLRTSSAARAWETEARALLLAAGWQPLPPGTYELGIEYILHTVRTRDIDSPSKVLLDLIARVLAVDDRYVSRLMAVKRPVRRAEQRIEVTVHIQTVGMAPNGTT